MVNLDNGAEREPKQVVVGWSPNGDENHFALSPTRFCHVHKLSACQSGIVRFLSRYQFEKNPWLIDQSRLLAQLLIEFGTFQQNALLSRIRARLGLENYIAPRIRVKFGFGLNVSSYCLVNGISPQIALLIGIVCNTPTLANMQRADELMVALKAKR